MMKRDMCSALTKTLTASLPHRPGEVAGQRGTEEMPVAQPLIFPWQRYKHIEQ